MLKVGIIGATGYAGGELVRLVSNHSELKNLCQQSSQKHKQHYNELLNYLNSH